MNKNQKFVRVLQVYKMPFASTQEKRLCGTNQMHNYVKFQYSKHNMIRQHIICYIIKILFYIETN